MNLLISLVLSFWCFSRTLTVQELIGLADAYSPRLKSEIQNVQASEARVLQARTLANPILTYQGGRLRSGNLSGSVTDITLGQPLPWPGKRFHRIRSQEFLTKLSEVSREEATLEVAHRVYLLGAELAALQELFAHYSERKRRFSLIQKSLRSRPLASPRQKVDRDLIESQINLLEMQMLDLEMKKNSLMWELKVYTNTDFERVKFNWEVLPQALSKSEYIDLIPSGPRGKKMVIEKDLSRTKIEEARLEARPDILVGVNYRQENVAPVNHFYHGQVSVVIPIIDRGQHSVQTAKAEERKVAALHQLNRDELVSSVHRFYADYEANKKAMEVFDLKKISRFEESFIGAEASFRKGLIDAISFLQIDSQVHENIDQIYLTRFDYLNALSNLNLLVGKSPGP
jgi:outer membrane protein TolC